MTRRTRDLEAERATIQAAAARLLAGTPLRSKTGKLTGTELITECGLRRDVVYGDHKSLVEEFQARARNQSVTPDVVRETAEQNTALKEQVAALKAELTVERERSKALSRIAAELSLELQQVREESDSAYEVRQLPRSRSPRR
ncbi:hypothetical protein ACIQNG_34070 [Streptomyces sp. NPDC091377]|uniref:hypothetical protein n=1 Tax=Streptomyces sp. NPDC091377 TaxID=3365995 RepID=UPI0038133D57